MEPKITKTEPSLMQVSRSKLLASWSGVGTEKAAAAIHSACAALVADIVKEVILLSTFPMTYTPRCPFHDLPRGTQPERPSYPGGHIGIRPRGLFSKHLPSQSFDKV